MHLSRVSRHIGLLLSLAACHHASAPTPATSPTPQPAPPAAAQGAGRAGGTPGRAGGTPGRAGGRAPRISPESAAVLRKADVDKLMAKIKGSESLPAEDVFQDVRLLTGMTAQRFLQVMDVTYGGGLGMTCADCHQVANWADSTQAKTRARSMQEVTNTINTELLTKVMPRPDQITCITCHQQQQSPPRAPAVGRGGRGG
jgi:Photosynthetic reaction centre cytochrome C subunit